VRKATVASKPAPFGSLAQAQQKQAPRRTSIHATKTQVLPTPPPEMIKLPAGFDKQLIELEFRIE
jgi:hypothetical protein